MAGETDLARLLATMRPTVREGHYVFVSLTSEPGVPVEALVREDVITFAPKALRATILPSPAAAAASSR